MSSYLSRECPAENTIGTDQSSFFDGRWDAHEKGWVIAGATAFVSVVISIISILKHARNYYVPKQQRQIIRILWMPAVYGVVSFFSYRFFRAYTYYSVAVVAYEALVLAAFLMLLLQYVDFLHALKWSVLQYSLLRPLISIIEIICQAYDVLCPTHYSVYFAEAYLDAVDFVSISVALYGLIVFYALVKEQLAGKKPLAKFLCIKFVVMVLFYQSFVFSVLQSHGVIKATEFWTATNVADGLSALCTCCEMVIFSFWFMWAFNWSEYTQLRETRGSGKPTSVLWALVDSFNYWDFLKEGGKGIKFLFDYVTNKPGTRSGSKKNKTRRRRHDKGDDDEEKRDQLHQGGGAADDDDDDRLVENKVGLDFEKAFESVKDGSDDGLGERYAAEEEDSAIYPEGRSGYAGVGARDRFAERSEIERFEEDARNPYHASNMAQAAFQARSLPPLPPPASDSFDAYRPLPHDHLPAPESSSAHPYANTNLHSTGHEQTTPRDDWRPYTPPNVSNGVSYRPIR